MDEKFFKRVTKVRKLREKIIQSKLIQDLRPKFQQKTKHELFDFCCDHLAIKIGYKQNLVKIKSFEEIAIITKLFLEYDITKVDEIFQELSINNLNSLNITNE